MYDAIETFNTFTVVGRCERTGMLGVAITSHAFAVGSRCPFVEARIGVIEEVAASDRFPERHQVGIADRDGNSAAVTGSDLRVDAHDEPIGELGRIFEL